MPLSVSLSDVVIVTDIGIGIGTVIDNVAGIVNGRNIVIVVGIGITMYTFFASVIGSVVDIGTGSVIDNRCRFRYHYRYRYGS